MSDQRPAAAQAALRPEALTEWHRLSGSLLRLADEGLTIPCWSHPEPFTSDNPAERAAAAQWCQTCPALRPCLMFAEANGERFGTWGGLDRTPRPRPRPTRHRRPSQEVDLSAIEAPSHRTDGHTCNHDTHERNHA